MKSAPGTYVLTALLLIVFGVEMITGRMGDETALLAMGALPASSHLDGQLWRLVTYAFLHLNWTHLIFNLALLIWVGRIVERRVGTARAALLYFVSVLISGVAILIRYSLSPGQGSAVGASGGIFGLLAVALILVYRKDMAAYGQDRGLKTGLWVCLAAGIAMSILPGVSYAGHLGGLISGLTLGFVIAGKDEPAWLRLAQRSKQ